MSNTVASKDSWGILKLSETIFHSHMPPPSFRETHVQVVHSKQNKDRVFEKAFFVTHADIFNVFADDAYDDMFETIWENSFLGKN